jgi:NitT/TauT family transport system permease protein
MVKRLLWQSLAIAIFVALWWAAAAYSDSQLLPTPPQTLREFFRVLSSSRGWESIGNTCFRVLAGTFIGALTGTLLGIITRYNRLAEVAVRSVVYPLLQSVPSICWALMLVIWFGLSQATPILVIAVAVAPFFIINIWEGLKELDMSIVEMASTYTRSHLKMLAKVILPMLYAYIFAALRSSFMVAWKVVILAEVLGAVSGIGYMLWISYQVYNIDRVFAWTMISAIIIIVFDYGIFNYIDRRFIRRWKPQELKLS